MLLALKLRLFVANLVHEYRVNVDNLLFTKSGLDEIAYQETTCIAHYSFITAVSEVRTTIVHMG